jgi:hypothetical protein
LAAEEVAFVECGVVVDAPYSFFLTYFYLVSLKIVFVGAVA